MQSKHPIDAARMRKVLPRGFGWIDHRLLRQGHIGRASVEALALYLLLVCAADAQGLSFYSETRIAQLLGLAAVDVARARRELIGLDLILYRRPIYQVLSLERTQEQPIAKPAAQCRRFRQEQRALPTAQPQEAEEGIVSIRAAFEALLKNPPSPA